jgi:hypothetical protein
MDPRDCKAFGHTRGGLCGAMVIVGSKPETGSNAAAGLFRGRQAMELSGLESADIIQTFSVVTLQFRMV